MVRTSDVLHTQELDIAEFFAMNPLVKSDCSGMSIGIYYCVSTYPGGSTPGFPGYATVSSSPVSSTVVAESKSVKASTGILTPSPIQTGMVSTCNKFYKVITDDSCYDIANDNGISLSSFYDWNPAVKTDCSGLQADEYVCVAVA
ncbi:hypothetical protein N7494_007706 [Penicillium frequentans]|uniref:LysM domain-containing protein n=1 Tax=Penicillium frequentans TaxID=3151616 RepID=A0AAD6GEY2_9EURO|nr:hypothetical protein N7494_007706 [Penicillium glabrum]